MDALSSIIGHPWFRVFLVFAAALLIPFLVNIWNGWQSKRNAVNSPLKITLSTDKTPADVNAAARAAKRNMLLAGLVAFAIFMAVLHAVNIEAAKSLDRLLMQGAIAFMDLLSAAFGAISDLLEGWS